MPGLKGKAKQTEEIISNESFNMFVPSDLPDHFTLMYACPRGSGKTHSMRYILRDIRTRFQQAYVFSETASVQEDVYSFVPENHLFDHYDESAMASIFKKQKEIFEKNKGMKKSEQVKNDILIVLDDCVNSKEFQNSVVLKNLFTLGRHYHISIVLLMQNLSSRDGASVILRKNADCFITFSVFDMSTKEMIASTFASIISKSDGMDLISRVTEETPYQALVFLIRDKNGKKNIKKYSDYCYKYLAPSEPCQDFFIGRKREKKFAGRILAPNSGRLFQFKPAGYSEVVFEGTVAPPKEIKIRLRI